MAVSTVLHHHLRGSPAPYHQLSNDRLIEVLRAHIHTLSDQIASIHMFLLHTALPLLQTSGALFLQATSLPLLFRFAPLFQRGHVTVTISIPTATDTQDRQVRPASARARVLTYHPAAAGGIGRGPLLTVRRAGS